MIRMSKKLTNEQCRRTVYTAESRKQRPSPGTTLKRLKNYSLWESPIIYLRQSYGIFSLSHSQATLPPITCSFFLGTDSLSGFLAQLYYLLKQCIVARTGYLQHYCFRLVIGLTYPYYNNSSIIIVQYSFVHSGQVECIVLQCLLFFSTAVSLHCPTSPLQNHNCLFVFLFGYFLFVRSLVYLLVCLFVYFFVC